MAKYEKRVKELKEYRLTRGGDLDTRYFETLTRNLITNLSKRNNKIHKQLQFSNSNSGHVDEDLKIDAGHYICSLITCWESFFMDTFIFLCNHDPQIRIIFETKHSGEDLQGLTIGEYAAIRYSFQNLDRMREAFDLAFSKITTKFTQHLDANLFSDMASTTRLRIMEWSCRSDYLDLIESRLNKAFEIRHKFTHDANYSVEYEPELFANIEEVFQVLPQVFMHDLAAKYNMSRTVLNTQKLYIRETDRPKPEEKPYIFSGVEFSATNWEIVEDDPGHQPE